MLCLSFEFWVIEVGHSHSSNAPQKFFIFITSMWYTYYYYLEKWSNSSWNRLTYKHDGDCTSINHPLSYTWRRQQILNWFELIIWKTLQQSWFYVTLKETSYFTAAVAILLRHMFNDSNFTVTAHSCFLGSWGLKRGCIWDSDARFCNMTVAAKILSHSAS